MARILDSQSAPADDILVLRRTGHPPHLTALFFFVLSYDMTKNNLIL